MQTRREKGVEGEDIAVRTLKKKGYKIIERNYKNFLGEIDIIAEEDGYLVFIEVKRRSSSAFGESLLAIDGKKRLHIVKSATFYLKDHKYLDRRVRFDVVGIDGERVKVVKHAFTADE